MSSRQAAIRGSAAGAGVLLGALGAGLHQRDVAAEPDHRVVDDRVDAAGLQLAQRGPGAVDLGTAVPETGIVRVDLRMHQHHVLVHQRHARARPVRPRRPASARASRQWRLVRMGCQIQISHPDSNLCSLATVDRRSSADAHRQPAGPARDRQRRPGHRRRTGQRGPFRLRPAGDVRGVGRLPRLGRRRETRRRAVRARAAGAPVPRRGRSSRSG